MFYVEAQKNKNIQDSYKLEGKIEEFKNLEIVRSARITKDEINVSFIAKNLDKQEGKEKAVEKSFGKIRYF